MYVKEENLTAPTQEEYAKNSKKTPWQRIAANVKDSSNGVKVLARENKGLQVLGIVAIIIWATLIAATRLISGEWFSVLENFIIAAELFLLLVTETLNTAIEILCDRVTKRTDPDIKKVKDVSSAAVYYWWILSCLTAIFFVVCHSFHFPWYRILTQG